MNTFESLRLRYSEADFLQPRHVEATQRFLKDRSRADAKRFTADNLVTYHLGHRAFQALLHTPPNPSDQAIVVPTGYGTGFGVHAVTRAMVIREVVDPHATLVVQANASPVYFANNFSPTEGQLLDQGDFKPMRDRLNLALEDLSQRLPDARVAYAGGSLGAAVVGSVLGHTEEMALGSNGGTIIDPANIVRRKLAQLGRDFAWDLDEMTRAGAANFSWDWWLRGLSAKQEGASRGAKVSIAAARVALREAFYLARALGHEQLLNDLLAAPEEVGILHMWSRWSHVSPDSANQRINREMAANAHPLYQPVRITHPKSRHGVTVTFALQAAALDRAIELSQHK